MSVQTFRLIVRIRDGYTRYDTAIYKDDAWYWTPGQWTPYDSRTGEANALPMHLHGPFANANDAVRDWQKKAL